jgi:hypothetical protein
MLPNLTGPQFVAALEELGVTHVVWLPDSVTGKWEPDLEASPRVQLVRVCREGEAWAIAGGLHIGGATPLVVIQNTGLFESGDALRNMLLDFRLPLYALIGCRSFLVEGSTDTARHFTEPVLRAWGVDYQLLDAVDPLPQFVEQFEACRAANRAGFSLLPEGRN